MPTGLEGAYQLALRGLDMAGNTGAGSQSALHTEVDTLAPRVSLTRVVTGTGATQKTTFTLVAQDFNLTSNGLQTPCATGAVTTTQYFNAPWFLAPQDAHREAQV